MFEKIGRLAEKAADSISVSRRGFLGRIGKAALGAAGVVGGLSTLTGRARRAATTHFTSVITEIKVSGTVTAAA